MRTRPTSSVQEVGHLADLLDRTVVGVLGRDEFRAGELVEDRRIVDGEQRRAQLVLEAGAVDLRRRRRARSIDSRERSASPRSRSTCAGSTLPAFWSSSQTEIVDHPDLVGAGLHQLDGAAVVAGEADAREDFLGAAPPNALRMKYSGIRRPEVEAREPKVKDLPAISFGNSLEGLSPVLVLAMTNDLNATSSAPCAIASEPAPGGAPARR